MRKALFCLFAIALASSVAYAHEDGASYERRIGDYDIDIGYSGPDKDGLLTLDFDARNATTQKPAAYEFIWVRISSNSREVFAGSVGAGTFGKPTISLFIPVSGTYDITARWSRETESLAEASFSLPIAMPVKEKPETAWLFVAIGLVAGVLCASAAIWSRRSL